MIFISKNENGEPAWQLVLEGRKTVTRRANPQPVGSMRAVCPGRGKKALGYIQILKCDLHMVCDYPTPESKQAEAEKEGFKGWEGLLEWFRTHGGWPLCCYRIEFKLV